MINHDSEVEHWGSIWTLIILSIMIGFTFYQFSWDKEEKPDKNYEATTYPEEFIAGYREDRNE